MSLLKKSGVGLSNRTVERFLKTEGLKYLKIKREIQLSDRHKTERKGICRDWLMNGTSSKKVAFTDESRFNLDGPDSQMSWQHSKNRMKRPRRQQGGGGIMILGMLMLSGQLNCYEVQGIINSAKYIKLLSDFALPLISYELGNDWLPQQDNAPAHTSAATQLFLEAKLVELLGWPALSPDLNVIENVWHFLANMMYRDGAAHNIVDLREKIQRAVTQFNTNPTAGINIYQSFGRRIMECYDSDGAKVHG